MFRFCRKAVFPRWHAKRQTQVEKKKNVSCPKALILSSSSEKKSYSDSNQKEKKQHANRQEKRFWDDPQFHCNFFHSSLFETAGVLGTVTLCFFNYHRKHLNHVWDYDRIDSSCIFANVVSAMPKRSSQANKSHTVSDLVIQTPFKQVTENDNISEIGSSESIRKLIDQYAAIVENAGGVENINKNARKAFRSFQTASRLGSSQAFYNLGLCYQFGRGTKVNLNRAAFCYRKAAMKGHGLASFNLAVFFLKGLGGLPVDLKLAKELLAQAAEEGVPEAQVYFGIEYLENKRWKEAVQVFSTLAKQNIPEGQYYLGFCYEKSLGVNKNEKIAFELYSKSAAQGNEKAAQKLKNYHNKRKQDMEDSLVSTSLLKHNGLHVSSSVPELSALVKKPNQTVSKMKLLYTIRERRSQEAMVSHRIKNVQNPFELPEFFFVNRFRLSKCGARHLIEELRMYLKTGSNGYAVELQVLNSLRIMGSGSFQNKVADEVLQQISEPSTLRFLKDFIDALLIIDLEV